jgi:hypothetical protein
MGAEMMDELMDVECKILIATVDTSQPGTKNVLGTNVAIRIMKESKRDEKDTRRQIKGCVASQPRSKRNT